MKIKTQTSAPPKEFQPVTVSITFETKDELGVLTQFLGGLTCRTQSEALKEGIKRHDCPEGDAKELLYKTTDGLFVALENAYGEADEA
jgi:hypothetical protein